MKETLAVLATVAAVAAPSPRLRRLKRAVSAPDWRSASLQEHSSPEPPPLAPAPMAMGRAMAITTTMALVTITRRGLTPTTPGRIIIGSATGAITATGNRSRHFRSPEQLLRSSSVTSVRECKAARGAHAPTWQGACALDHGVIPQDKKGLQIIHLATS